jgi:hypothetical protein
MRWQLGLALMVAKVGLSWLAFMVVLAALILAL